MSPTTIWHRYSPVGIFFLVATRTSQVRDTGRVFRSIFEYVLTALACLLLYGLVFLPALYAAVTRRSLRRFLRLTTSPMLKAVRSASRAVSMPETIGNGNEVSALSSSTPSQCFSLRPNSCAGRNWGRG